MWYNSEDFCTNILFIVISITFEVSEIRLNVFTVFLIPPGKLWKVRYNMALQLTNTFFICNSQIAIMFDGT